MIIICLVIYIYRAQEFLRDSCVRLQSICERIAIGTRKTIDVQCRELVTVRGPEMVRPDASYLVPPHHMWFYPAHALQRVKPNSSQRSSRRVVMSGEQEDDLVDKACLYLLENRYPEGSNARYARQGSIYTRRLGRTLLERRYYIQAS